MTASHWASAIFLVSSLFLANSALGQAPAQPKPGRAAAKEVADVGKEPEILVLYIPFYLSYQMNGIYYFYCGIDCAATDPTMQSSSRMHLLGCENNEPRDPIESGSKKRADGPEGFDRARKLKMKAKNRKGGLGEHRDDDGNLVPEGTVYLSSAKDKVIADFACEVEGKYYFRVIGIESKNVPGPIKKSYFAHQLDEKPVIYEQIESHTLTENTVGKIVVKPYGVGTPVEAHALSLDKVKKP